MSSHSQQDLDRFAQAIGIALINILPRDWRSALLTLKTTDKGLGGGLAHNIRSGEGRTEIIMPDDELLLATRRLELYCRDHKIDFAETAIKVWAVGDDWEVDLKFHYDENVPKKKSWWSW